MHADYESAHLHAESKRQQRMCACLCLWCSIVVVAVLLICITVGLRYSGSRDVLQYPSTVGDTRLVSYSPGLCSGGQMNIDPSGFNGGMYFLDEKPPLSAWNILRLSGTFVISPSYAFYDYDFYQYEYVGFVYAAWQFHLNEGSIINARSCIAQTSGGGANFLVIQGSDNLNRWTNGVVIKGAYEVPLVLCGSGQTQLYSFSISEEAYYYVVYYATSGTPQIFLGLTINRTEYSIADVSGMPNCTLMSGSCETQSQSSTRYILFQTIPANSANISRVQDFTLTWMCESRDGVYVAIFFLPLIFLGLLFCGCFGIYCLCTRLLPRSKYSELGEDHPNVHAQPVSEKPPPPYSAGPL